MKLWYLYCRDSRIRIEHAQRDGHVDLINWFLDNGVVDDAVMIIDRMGAKSPEHHKTDGKLLIETRSGIDDLKPQIGDVIWVRGSFKTWGQSIQRWHRQHIWLIFYDANTGRRNWPYWDVGISDLIDSTRWTLREPRKLWWNYTKPVSRLFRLMPEYKDKLIYDVCIGASHIYDRKGQYHTYNAIKAYHKLFGKRLRCLLPGGYYCRERNTMQMRRELEAGVAPNVHYVGNIPRDDLVVAFNQSRVFSITAGGGHGDRGPIEAGMCGCPMIIGYTKYHSPYMWQNRRITLVPEDARDPELFARELHDWLEDSRGHERREEIAAWFREHGSIETGSGPRLRQLFDLFREYPMANRERLKALHED